jgi:hypothetical protein
MNDGMPPAGWYPDVLDPEQLRWWDGTAWTERVHSRPARPAPAGSPGSAAASDDAPQSRRELRSQVGALVHGQPNAPESSHRQQSSAVATLERPSEHEEFERPGENREELDPRAASTPEISINPALSASDKLRVAGGYSPLGEVHPDDRTWKYVPYRASAQTLPGWLLAFYPVWSGAGLAVAHFLLPADQLFARAGILLLMVLLIVGLVRADAARLRDRGFAPVASPWWILLPIVYFVMRIVRTGSGSVALLLTFLFADVVIAGAALVAFSAIFGVPLQTLLQGALSAG